MSPNMDDRWLATIVKLQQAGLLQGLGYDAMTALLGVDGTIEPTAAAITRLLHRWYGAAGDPLEAHRRRAGALALVPEGEDPTVVAALLAATTPELARLYATVTPSALIVTLDGEQAVVSKVVQHARVPGREVRRPGLEPRHVFKATNALVARLAGPKRFIELDRHQGVHQLAWVSHEGAQILFRLGVTLHPSLEEVFSFAAWSPQFSSPRPARA